GARRAHRRGPRALRLGVLPGGAARSAGRLPPRRRVDPDGGAPPRVAADLDTPARRAGGGAGPWPVRVRRARRPAPRAGRGHAAHRRRRAALHRGLAPELPRAERGRAFGRADRRRDRTPRRPDAVARAALAAPWAWAW